MPDKKKILLIGWDAADWKIINPLIDAGLMPSLEKMVNNGVMGNISTLEPPFSPMLWTSIATGMYPDKHGILGFSEPTPDGKSIRPVSSLSRKVKAIWNILMQNGYKVNVAGWWPSHPAEPINGIMVSNHYAKASGSSDNWPMLNDTVHPKALEELTAWLRVHPSELTSEHLLPFVPRAAEINQEKDNCLDIIAKNIAEASSYHAVTTWMMENTDWDFTAVYLDTIDHFSHGFMHYHPPKMNGISDEKYELYNDVINSAYRYHDMMLGRLLELAGEDATVILLSDHGFHSDHLRPTLIRNEPAGPAKQHREHGIICIKGPGIKKDDMIYGATLLDITPTILTLCGLPLGKDMDGVPLLQAMDIVPEITQIPSWEEVEGDCGMHPSEMREDTFLANDAIDQLVKLGYIEKPDENIQITIEKTISETQYNLARSYLGARRYREASELLEKLYIKNKEPRFATRLIMALIGLGELQKAEHTILEYKDTCNTEIEHLNIEIEELNKKLNQTNSDNTSSGTTEELEQKINSCNNMNKEYQNALIHLEMNEADIAQKRGNYQKTLEIYKAIGKKRDFPDLHLKMGDTYGNLNRWKEAETEFRKVITIDPHNASAHHGLALSSLNQGDYDSGIDHLLESIALHHQNPGAHYMLGKTLFELKEFESSAVSLEVTLLMAPNMGVARNLLIEIYEKHLNNPQKANEHKEFFTAKTDDSTIQLNPIKHLKIPQPVVKQKALPVKHEKPIIVVSGLPRSGTSLMMQILDKAGVRVFTDDHRPADESNPKGYFEHRWVKRLPWDNSWMQQAEGSAVKVVSHLLFYLPPRHNYKLIFMQRDLKEVVFSQSQMLARKGLLEENNYPYNLEVAYAKNLEKANQWINKNHNIDVMYVDQAQLINDPASVINKLCDFIDIKTDKEILASVVDKKLHRVKNEHL